MNIFQRLMMPKALRKNKEIIYYELISDGIYFTVSEDLGGRKRNIIYAVDKSANQYIGFLEFTDDKFIKNLFVRHKYRRQGHGYNLISHALIYFDVNKAFVNKDNEAAINLFKKIGFKLVGPYYYETEIVFCVKADINETIRNIRKDR